MEVNKKYVTILNTAIKKNILLKGGYLYLKFKKNIRDAVSIAII